MRLGRTWGSFLPRFDVDQASDRTDALPCARCSPQLSNTANRPAGTGVSVTRENRAAISAASCAWMTLKRSAISHPSPRSPERKSSHLRSDAPGQLDGNLVLNSLERSQRLRHPRQLLSIPADATSRGREPGPLHINC